MTGDYGIGSLVSEVRIRFPLVNPGAIMINYFVV